MSVRRKKIIIASIFILAFLVFYLNRSYAHIFNYEGSRTLLAFDMVREYSLENGRGNTSLTYVALGDSLTYGLAAPNTESTFPYIIAKNLLKKNKTVNVYNLGVSGAIAEDLLENQLPKTIELKPDLVTVMIGTNDVHDLIDKENFKNSLEKIIDELKEKTTAKIILINIPYLGTDNLILPPYNIVIDNRIKDFNNVIAEVAVEKNIELFDLYTKSYVSFKQNQKLYYSIDEFHPSGEGYILWGDLINGN